MPALDINDLRLAVGTAYCHAADTDEDDDDNRQDDEQQHTDDDSAARGEEKRERRQGEAIESLRYGVTPQN